MITSVLSVLLATLAALTIPIPDIPPNFLVLAQDTSTQTTPSFPEYGIGVIFVYETNESWATYPPCSSLTPPAGCLTSAGQFAWSYCGSYASHGNGTISVQLNENNNTRLDVYYDEEFQNYFVGTVDVFEGGEEEEDEEGTTTAAVWRLFGENDEEIPPEFLVTELPASLSSRGGRRTAGPLWYLDRAQDNEFDLASIQTETHSVGSFGLCFIRFDDGDED
ncbi:hypothetical protein BDW60DRAFT_211534 [Aspergillus nidulans var. acristatus]